MQCFYIDDFLDETTPCDMTLEGWADWLSKPDLDWGRSEQAKDGDTFFAGDNTEFIDDIIATRRSGGEWTFSRAIEGDFFAVRLAQGLGWSPENIIEIWDENTTPEQAVRDWFADNSEFLDDQEFIAVGKSLPAATLTYRANPPRIEVEWATANG